MLKGLPPASGASQASAATAAAAWTTTAAARRAAARLRPAFSTDLRPEAEGFREPQVQGEGAGRSDS